MEVTTRIVDLMSVVLDGRFLSSPGKCVAYGTKDIWTAWYSRYFDYTVPGDDVASYLLWVT